MDEISSRIVSETYSAFSNLSRPPDNLAFESASHFSRGCEKFCSTCTQKFLPQPLEGIFHFCCEKNETSQRKRTLSLRASGGDSPSSCYSGSSTPSENRCHSPIEGRRTTSVEQRNSNEVLKRMRVESPVFVESTIKGNRYVPLSFQNTPLVTQTKQEWQCLKCIFSI